MARTRSDETVLAQLRQIEGVRQENIQRSSTRSGSIFIDIPEDAIGRFFGYCRRNNLSWDVQRDHTDRLSGWVSTSDE